MSETNYRINQHNNIGLTQALHYGDNVFYSARAELTPKHVALETHKKVKAGWELSGTCEWLLKEPGFQSWEEMDAGYSFLWLHGRPGCGKSTLMSRIIEHLYGRRFAARGPNAIHLLYFYVGFGDEQEKDKLYRTMLLTFWEQSIQKAEGKSINTFGNHSAPELIEKELQKLLVQSRRDIYILIDALDQLPSNSQYQLIGALSTMVEKLKNDDTCGRLSVAISSRDCNGIDQLHTHTLIPIEVTAKRNKHDIETYLKKSLNSRLLDRNPVLKEKVFDKLNDNADGMFLWVSLQALNICEMELETQVMKVLQNLVPPQRMQEMYRAYADGFESLSELIQQQITHRTMALLAHSTGSMSKEVLLVALSLDANGEVDQMLHQELASRPDKIVRFCNHLVFINENLGNFQFCHRTVFEFFTGYKPVIYHRRIAELCLSHLSSGEFSQGPRSDATWFNLGSLGPILQRHPFLRFASSKWASSVKRSLESQEGEAGTLKGSHSKIFDLFKFLFNKGEAAEEKMNLQLSFQVHLLHRGKTMPGGACHEHIVSYFALVGLLDIFRERGWFDLAKRDDDGLRPIHWAIRNEMELDEVALTVGKLIEYGADINVRDKDGRTPLYYAAYCGNLQVTRLLNDNGAGLDLRDNNDETPLITACRKHHQGVVLYLVQAKADVKIQSSFGTALQAISLVGCCLCAKEILDRCEKTNIVEHDGPFGSPLHVAAFHGHSDLVKLLCSKGTVNPAATHRTYGSPVTAAATGFNPGLDPAPFLEIIERLLKYGVKVNDRSGLVGPALRAAAYHGSLDLVRLLLQKGAKVRKAKGPMGTAYEAADERGHEEVKDLLLKSDPKAADYAGTYTSKTLIDRQRVQRTVFRATVKMSSMDTIDSLISQFEIFFGKEIKKGVTPFLKGLAKLGEDGFQDVIKLATKPRGKPKTTKRHDKGGRWRARAVMMSNIFCMCVATGGADALAPGARPTTPETSRHLRRAGSTFVQDGIGEHIPQVLDRMTQAAVKILDDAIASKDRAVLILIANTWVEALNNLVSYPGFGESMLEMVVQRRANELKGHLTDPDLSPEERFAKAEALALVGIELLLVAVERGQKFKHLSFVISKIFVKAVDDVEDLGEAGEAPVRQLIRIFAERFSGAIMARDQVNAGVCAQAGIELVRAAAALTPKVRLLGKFCGEWAARWEQVLEHNMENMAKELLRRRWEEYQECVRNEKHDEAFGLALAGIGVFRAAMERGSGRTASMLQPFIESGFRLAQERGYADREAPSSLEIGAIFNAVVSLFTTAEGMQPGCLDALAAKILDLVVTVSDDYYQDIVKVANHHIERAGQIVYPPEREKQCIDICRTLIAFVDLALRAEEKRFARLSILKRLILGDLAGMLPKFMNRDESARYTKAIRYLKAQDDEYE